jgi:hypothetical protein
MAMETLLGEYLKHRRSFTGKLDAYGDLTDQDHRAINHGTAWTLFPRLVPKHDTASQRAPDGGSDRAT